MPEKVMVKTSESKVRSCEELEQPKILIGARSVCQDRVVLRFILHAYTY